MAMARALEISPDEVRAAVKDIIASIKEIPDAQQIPDDAPLFGDDPAGLSPLQLDSLDALDLALALKDRFDPVSDRLESLLSGEEDLQALTTVNEIVDFILSAASQEEPIKSALDRPGAGDEWRGPVQL